MIVRTDEGLERDMCRGVELGPQRCRTHFHGRGDQLPVLGPARLPDLAEH